MHFCTMPLRNFRLQSKKPLRLTRNIQKLGRKMIALAAGMILAFITIIGIKFSNNENSAWGYPLVLASLPICYIGFALYANDSEAVLPEILHGLPIYILVIWSAIKPSRLLTILVAFAFIWHGIYDFIHPWLFTNKGTPQ